MPQRFLRPGITNSDHWNKCSFEAQSFYIRLLTLVDDFGRFDGRIPILHGQCFALRPDIKPQDSAAFRSELHANNLIDVYEVDGKEYVQMLRWQERARSERSKFPDPAGSPQEAAAERSNPQDSAGNGSNPQEKDASLVPRSSPLHPRSSILAITSSPPPTVPQGGQASESSELITTEAEAKRLICQLILKGKNPDRPWSHEAQRGLADQLPIPLREIKLVDWFHRLPFDSSVHELKVRRQSEGTLMPNWSDEVTRAERLRKKMGVDVDGERKKKEPENWREIYFLEYGEIELPASFFGLTKNMQDELPALRKKHNDGKWREFFRWKYSDDCLLPDAFEKLADDLKNEFHRDFVIFNASQKKDAPTNIQVMAPVA